jgi:myosin heavy subunit
MRSTQGSIKVHGANITSYLLEKSRVVAQGPNERNYHIFYQIIKGMNDKRKESLGLRSIEQFFYLSMSGCSEIDHVDDAAEYRTLLSALKTLGFDTDLIYELLQLVAGVLHLGNVSFELTKEADGTSGSGIVGNSDKALRWVAGLVKVKAFHHFLEKKCLLSIF